MPGAADDIVVRSPIIDLVDSERLSDEPAKPDCGKPEPYVIGYLELISLIGVLDGFVLGLLKIPWSRLFSWL